MSNRIKHMKQDIKKYTAFIIGVFCTLIIWLISPTWLTSFLEELPKWVNVITWLSTLILGALASYFIILDIHNWFDKKFFGERKKVDNFIRMQITKPCKEVSCDRAKMEIMKDEENKLMDLFYTFIPADGTERERAFAYWTEYFITVNLSVFSVLALIIALIYIAFFYFFNPLPKILHSPFIIIFLLAIFFNIARLFTRRKLIDPARAQTTRILSDNKSDLISRLFNYRENCRNCPLRSQPPRK